MTTQYNKASATQSLTCVVRSDFIRAYMHAREENAKIREATSPAEELPEVQGNTAFFLSADKLSGFIVKDSGELVALFSLERGRGAYLVEYAKLLGATHLDCFAGYLPELYQRHGFVTFKRVPNWTKGEPSVHFMRLFESKAA